MSVIERRIEMLKLEASMLTTLLDDPHPGLSMRLQEVPRRVANMQAILDGKHDAEDAEQPKVRQRNPACPNCGGPTHKEVCGRQIRDICNDKRC